MYVGIRVDYYLAEKDFIVVENTFYRFSNYQNTKRRGKNVVKTN